MKHISIVILIIVCLVVPRICLGEDNSVNAQPSMKVFYVPFSVAPYASITDKNIESSSDYLIWFYRKHRFIATLTNQLERHQKDTKIDKKNIRLKVVLHGGTSYSADRHGNVLKSNGQHYKLDAVTMESIEETIESYSGVVDRRPHVAPWPE